MVEGGGRRGADLPDDVGADGVEEGDDALVVEEPHEGLRVEGPRLREVRVQQLPHVRLVLRPGPSLDHHYPRGGREGEGVQPPDIDGGKGVPGLDKKG